MNKENVSAVLDALAARLSVPASHLWAVLVRQAAIEFWTTVVLAVVVSVVATVLIRAALREMNREGRGAYEDGYLMVLTIGSVVTGIFAAVLLGMSVTQVGYLINPEYYALETVLKVLK